MRFRTGAFGTFNAILGVLGFMAFSALAAVTAASIHAGQNVVWSLVGGLVSVAAALAMALVAAEGIGTWRSVRLTVDPGGSVSLSVPGFTFRRGFYRQAILVPDVTDVRLDFRSVPRNSRWQLVVTRRNGNPVRSDSITSSRSRDKGVHGTRAWRTVLHLQQQIHAAQRA